jgi:hypothetical protein
MYTSNFVDVVSAEQKRFRTSLWTSFAILANLSIDEAQTVDSWQGWQPYFAKLGEKNLWNGWFVRYGIGFMTAIEKDAAVLNVMDRDSFRQAAYMLEEANESLDYEYVLEMASHCIEWLKKRGDALMMDVVRAFVDEEQLGCQTDKEQIRIETEASSVEDGAFFGRYW